MVREIALREIEQDVYNKLNRHAPHLPAVYQAYLPQARQRILHQLIQAILREDLFQVSWAEEGGNLKATIVTSSKGVLTIPIKKRYILHHIDIGADIHCEHQDRVVSLTHPVDLVRTLDIEEKRKQNLCRELDSAVVHDALAMTGAKWRRDRLPQSSGRVNGTFAYLLNEKQTHEDFSPLVFAEQWVIKGHTLHPCTKTRIGIDVLDVLQDAPEWGGSPEVIPVAVHHSLVNVTAMTDRSLTDILLSEYPEVKEAFEEQLRPLSQVHGPHDIPYEIIPVHRWQYQHVIQPLLTSDMARGLVVPLKGVPIHTQALLSYRTLAPYASRSRHHIKTAMNVQMTSAKRIVSPTSVFNGPVISSILDQIYQQDDDVARQLSFSLENGGVHYQAEGDGDGDADADFLSKNVAALLRSNPEADLGHDEVAIPAAFLISESPVTDQTVLVECIEHLASERALSFEDAAVQYIGTYARQLIPALLTLMTKYGVSMEAHLQNAIPVMREGMPVRFILRDNGGIRIKASQLRSTIGHVPQINNDTNVLTEQDEDLFTMFSHAILHNHLGEMIVLLARERGVSEVRLWRPVAQSIKETLDHLKAEQASQRVAEVIEKMCLSSHAPLKALLKMRLMDRITDNAYTRVPNPLQVVEKEGDGSCQR
ncbi:IucA/IucC family protein [Caldalkalibacillus salinus]|uniref:IucA/IucC family protein n=1 Tax=Caldalkalibacillus salinus TaxID=2803787 RepID=UPI001921CF5B|nr:IucA/IucC family protein [Caldalkalibacillus salinus]